MCINFSNLQEYHQNNILQPQAASTFKAKAQCFFNNDGLSKILIVAGIILAVVASIACAVYGFPPLGIENPWGIVQLVGVVTGVLGLLGICIHQASLISRLNQVIDREIATQRVSTN